MRPRVVFVLSSLCFGGAEKHTVALVNGLSLNGFEVSLIYLKGEKHLLEDLRPEVRARTHCLNKRSRLDAGLLLRLRQQLALMGPDVIVCVNNYPLLLVDLVRWSLPMPTTLLAVLHSTVLDRGWPERTVKAWLRHTINRRCARAVFVSAAQRDHWQQHYGITSERTEVIHNGVDTAYFTASLTAAERAQRRRELAIAPHDVVIACCAALRPEKRHLDLVEALEQLVAVGAPVRLMLIGEGPQRLAIESAVEAKRLTERCTITGFQHDVRPWLEAADIVVLASRTEAFPMAVIEAMSMGKPVVASRVGGIPEQVESGRTGYLFESGNVPALAESLQHMIGDGRLAEFGVAAREVAQEKFSESRMVARYAALLDAEGRRE